MVITNVQFDYHMYGINTGTLSLQALVDGSWTTAWSKSGQQHTSSGASYTTDSIDLTSLGNVTAVRFHFTGYSGYRSDTAIDNLKVTHIDGSVYTETFESGVGQWFNGGGTYAWIRDASGTPSGSTGPGSGSNSSWYMYVEASNGNSSSTVILQYTSPIINTPPQISAITEAETVFDTATPLLEVSVTDPDQGQELDVTFLVSSNPEVYVDTAVQEISVSGGATPQENKIVGVSTEPLAEGTWYWRAFVVDGQSPAVYSTIRSFDISLYVPPKPLPTPGPFTSPTAGETVSGEVLVSWGASTKAVDFDEDTQRLTIDSPSVTIIDVDSATISDDAGYYTVTDNEDGTFDITPAGQLDDILSYRLYRDDGAPSANVTFTDHGDGTWTAVSDGTIVEDGAGYFEIHDAELAYLDADKYVVTDTTPDDKYLGTTEDPFMTTDIIEWSETTTARFRIEAFGNGEFSASRYSDYFTVINPKLFLVGEAVPGNVYVGDQLVSAIYIGNVRVF